MIQVSYAVLWQLLFSQEDFRRNVSYCHLLFLTGTALNESRSRRSYTKIYYLSNLFRQTHDENEPKRVAVDVLPSYNLSNNHKPRTPVIIQEKIAGINWNAYIYGPGHAETCLMPYANNKGADQPVHSCCLINTFVVHCLDSMICILALSKVSRF